MEALRGTGGALNGYAGSVPTQLTEWPLSDLIYPCGKAWNRPPFPSRFIVSNRSSPSRVRFAASRPGLLRTADPKRMTVYAGKGGVRAVPDPQSARQRATMPPRVDTANARVPCRWAARHGTTCPGAPRATPARGVPPRASLSAYIRPATRCLSRLASRSALG